MFEQSSKVGAGKVVPQPVEEAEKKSSGRREGNGDALPEGHRQARPGGKEMEDSRMGRPGRRHDLGVVERDVFRVEPAQDLAALVGGPEGSEDLDAIAFSRAGSFAGSEKPG
jgi:hypothetical protein